MWCFHDRLREFKFSDGALIKMCPDCTAFDTKRNDVLRTGTIAMPHAEERIHWAELLDEAELGEQVGSPWWLVNAGDAAGLLKAMYEERKQRKAKPTTLDDHEWVARQRPFPHTQEMPRRFNSYCAQCTEVVLSVKRPWVVRITKGVYLPIEHECNSVRVYNLQGNLIEVKAQ